MILRRFMQHIKDQNLFAVGLDVVVVIVGIFLGMQVTEWNEERNNRTLEIEYLKQLQTDLENDLIRLERIHQDAINSLDKANLLILGSKDEALVRQKPTEYAKAVREVVWSSYFSPTSVTWDEISTSGRMLLISSAKLRGNLIRYYDGGIGQWLDTFRELTIAYRLEVSGVLPANVEIALRGLPKESEELKVSVEDALIIRDAWLARPKLNDMLLQQVSLHSLRKSQSHRDGGTRQFINSLADEINEHLEKLGAND